MKIGDKVNLYFPGDESRVTAEVKEITGVGASLNKELDLVYKDGEEEYLIQGVPHHDDAPEGQAFWRLKGDPAPSRWADVDPSDDLVPLEPVPLEPEPEPKTTSRRKKK